MNGRTLLGLLLAALSVTGFASTFVFGSALTKNCRVSPETLAFLRFAIAGSVLLLFTLSERTGRENLVRALRNDKALLAWLGPVGTSVMAWFVFLGCARVSTANASMADALTPLMIFAVAALRYRRIAKLELAGLLLGFVGALLVIEVVNANGLALSAYSLGDVFILLAAATWGVYTVWGREPIRRMGSSVFSSLTMLAGAALFAPVVAFGGVSWPNGPKAWLLTGLLGIVSTLMPFWTWNAAQNLLPMSVLGVSAYFTPVVAVALAALFLGERATALQWLGTLLVLASAVIETGRAKRRPGTDSRP